MSTELDKVLYMKIAHERYLIPQIIVQRNIKGKRIVGRRKMSWLRNLREWYGYTRASVFRSAANICIDDHQPHLRYALEEEAQVYKFAKVGFFA